MSTPESPLARDLVTCPHCQLRFLGGAAPVPADAPSAALGPRTATILPDEPAAEAGAPDTPLLASLPPWVARFEITRCLGEGSFGRVYEALDPLLKRIVALKVAKPEQLTGQRRIERFQREARAAANLLHPHIVAVFDFGHDGPHHYIASVFVPGRSLAALLEELPKGKKLDLREAVQIVRKLAEALGYAHKQGIIHRDVKPGNVMMRDDGEPLLMDFGLAARLDETDKLTVAGQFMGTPEYTAPEQWRGRAHSESDQYSLGCLLFELLTGDRPFAGGSSEHYLMLHTQQPAPSPRTCEPDLPRDLETITLKCLEKEPGRRYPDCQALADDLRRWLEGEPIRTRPVRAWERVWKWGRRRPAMAAVYGLLVLLLVLGAGGGGVFWLWQRAERALALTEAAEREALRTSHQLAQEKRRTEEALVREQNANHREEAARNQLAQLSYLHQVNLAYREWQDGNISRADQLLEACDPRRREWEWRYVHRLCHCDLLTLKGHTHYVTCLAYSPDGRQAASGSNDQTVRLWDVAAGKEVGILRGHKDCVLGVAFSPDGRRLASASWDGTIKIWDIASQQNTRTLTGHRGRVWSAAFGPDGKYLASTGADRTVKVWEVGTGTLVHTLEGHTDVARNAVFSPDGKQLATASYDRTVKLWDAATGKELRTLKGHTGWVLSLAFHPDGRRLASASLDESVRIWDVAAGLTVQVLQGHRGLVWKVIYLPGGRQLATASRDSTVKIWDGNTGKEVRTFKGHTLGVTGVASSPDGRRLISSSWDGTLKVWDARASQEARSFRGHASPVLAVAFQPDGRRLATAAANETVRIWDIESGNKLQVLPGHGGAVLGLAYSADGRRLATSSSREFQARLPAWIQPPRIDPHGKQPARISSVKVWDVAAGREEPLLTATTRDAYAAAYSPDGRRLAAALEDGTVWVWNTAAGKRLHRLVGHTKTARSVAFSPDGKLLASAADDWKVLLWDSETGHKRASLEGHAAEVYASGLALIFRWEEYIK